MTLAYKYHFLINLLPLRVFLHSTFKAKMETSNQFVYCEPHIHISLTVCGPGAGPSKHLTLASCAGC